MNILPFVTILIFVISLLISSFFQGYKESALSKVGFTGSIAAYRLARNHAEHEKFKSSLPQPKSDKEATPREPSKKPKESFRENITDNSKFNLTPLLKDESPFLEEVFAKLLHELYPDFPTTPLAKEILIAARKLPETFTFEEIILPKSELHAYWYKMVKGSPGWPPISHFVICKNPKDKEVIVARKASIPLLKAFFGDELTEAILTLEKDPERKIATIKKEELGPLLAEYNFPPERRSYIAYGNTSTVRKTSLKKDPSSGITADVSYNGKEPAS